MFDWFRYRGMKTYQAARLKERKRLLNISLDNAPKKQEIKQAGEEAELSGVALIETMAITDMTKRTHENVISLKTAEQNRAIAERVLRNEQMAAGSSTSGSATGTSGGGPATPGLMPTLSSP